MFFFLPIIFLAFCSIMMRRYVEGWGTAFLFGAILCATVLTAITEFLSLFHLFSFYPVMTCWILCIFAVLKAILSGGNYPDRPKVDPGSWLLGEKILLGIIVFVVGTNAVTACVASPNTWDAMTYHLSRVEHWIQNKTIGFYPTNIIRQLYYTPWSEYAIAHLRILGGGATSPNFVQWFSMAGSLAGVALIAGQLGAHRRGQLLSAALTACLPMGILESVSTQNDYTCAFWLIVFVYFIIESQRRFISLNIVAAGLSLGLAFLTKGNSYIFAAPFLIWFGIANAKQRLVKGLMGLLLMAVCAGGLNLGHYIRCTQAFGSPLGASAPLTNAAFDWKILEGNVLRNMSLHLATPLMEVNDRSTKMVVHIARSIGVDINDPRSTFSQNFNISGMWLDEDYAGNLLHAMVFIAVFVLIWFYRWPDSRLKAYAGGVLASFLLFCMILRFQPWHSRFHLPLFVLFCPVAGIVLERLLKKWCVLLGLIIFLSALPWVFLNDQHPWFGNLSIWKQPKYVQYFYKHPNSPYGYAVVGEYMKSVNCRHIGLAMGEDSWEYPWWVLLEGKDLRLEHVNVTNQSATLKYPLGEFQPCAIIVSETAIPPIIMTGNAVYKPAGAVPVGGDKITIYLKLDH